MNKCLCIVFLLLASCSPADPNTQATLKLLIDNLLDAFAIFDPGRLITKPKIHILTHTPDDVIRYGPSIRFATEVEESYNALFRFCSILSNHQAPSRDIARQFAALEHTAFVLAGGYWQSESRWIQAGGGVQSMLSAHPFLKKIFGWEDSVRSKPGTLYFTLFPYS